jgi:hypothetical protein
MVRPENCEKLLQYRRSSIEIKYDNKICENNGSEYKKVVLIHTFLYIYIKHGSLKMIKIKSKDCSITKEKS